MRLLEQSSELMRSAKAHAYSTATQYLEVWAQQFVLQPTDQYAQPLDGVLTEAEVHMLKESFGYQDREQLLARVKRAVKSAWQTKSKDYESEYPNDLKFGLYKDAIYFFKPSAVAVH